jgi:hypothetical protein
VGAGGSVAEFATVDGEKAFTAAAAGGEPTDGEVEEEEGAAAAMTFCNRAKSAGPRTRCRSPSSSAPPQPTGQVGRPPSGMDLVSRATTKAST